MGFISIIPALLFEVFMLVILSLVPKLTFKQLKKNDAELLESIERIYRENDSKNSEISLIVNEAYKDMRDYVDNRFRIIEDLVIKDLEARITKLENKRARVCKSKS